MRLQAGEFAPALVAVDLFGQQVDLSQLRGQRVMLSFYRYASCPICNLLVHSLFVQHARLQAMGLTMLAVFQSPAESIRQHVGRQDAPFAMLADPAMTLYRRFGVESRWAGLLSLGVMRSAFAALRKGFMPGAIDGPLHRTPADFLIDETGRIAVAHYGRHIDDHLPLAQIEQWLGSRPRTAAQAGEQANES